MKKTLLYMTISAFAVVTLMGGTTAHAQSTGAYYMIVTQERTARNCTFRNSDLGLGGGVFVAGTTFCEEQNPLMMMFGSFPTAHTQYTPNYDQGSYNNYSYTTDDSYEHEDTEYHEEDEAVYEEDDRDIEPSKPYKKPESSKSSGTKSGSHSW